MLEGNIKKKKYCFNIQHLYPLTKEMFNSTMKMEKPNFYKIVYVCNSKYIMSFLTCLILFRTDYLFSYLTVLNLR